MKLLIRLYRIHCLILDANFIATADRLSEKIGVSERQIRESIALLKEIGAPIKTTGRYGFVYSTPWDFWIALEGYVVGQ